MPTTLFELNPAIDVAALADEFAVDGRVQIRDVLTAEAAAALHHVLASDTRWGMGWRAGEDGPHALEAAQFAAMSANGRAAIANKLVKSMQGDDYAFSYARFPILDAYLGQWDPDGPYDILLEHLNAAPFLQLVRGITGIRELRKADAQATLFAPNHFLAQHIDSHATEGWRIAYVLSMCRLDWRPDWGGYLHFFDDDGDVVAGYRPRFNALSLFAVPRPHAVSYVPPFAPIGRYSITGWFRDQ